MGLGLGLGLLGRGGVRVRVWLAYRSVTVEAIRYTIATSGSMLTMGSATLTIPRKLVQSHSGPCKSEAMIRERVRAGAGVRVRVGLRLRL